MIFNKFLHYCSIFFTISKENCKHKQHNLFFGNFHKKYLVIA